MVSELFIQISMTVLLAVVISAIMKFLRQPLLIGYILTGIISGPYFFNFIHGDGAVSVFSQMGVALLLFTVGLNLNPKVIKEVGKVSLITGVGQVLFTTIIGFFISRALGFEILTSIYTAVALSFSSTIIIMKLLSDKGDLDTVYGKISVGFLIVQDIIAIFILMTISSMSSGGDLSTLFVKTIIIAVVLIVILFSFSYFFLPPVMRFIAKSQEFLFLFSIAWCFAIASVFAKVDLSLEIGALLAGVALSISPYSNEISSKMKSIRDFFIVIFFIIIGSEMALGDVSSNLLTIIVLSLFVLLGNPFIVMSLMGVLGYTKRTGFMSGLTVAQISEFSLILIGLGITVGHLSSEVLSIVTMVGLITIAGSTYMISFSNAIYPKLSKYLNLFEKKNVKEQKKVSKSVDAILFGYNRIGFGILQSLKKIKKKYLVVDFNPDTVEDLQKYKIPSIYGDVYDIEFLNELPLDKMKLAVSTIPDFETNMLLIEAIRVVNKGAVIIVRAHHIEEALELYKKGADYVLTPHFLGGEYVSKMIREIKVSKEKYGDERKRHINLLKEIKDRGHEHPREEGKV